MIKEEFFIDRGGYPVFKVEDKYYMLHDMGTTDMDLVSKIIKDIESFMKGETETVDLEGYDTTFIECSKDGCFIYWEVKDAKIGPLPIEWIYNLFKHWLEFLQKNQANK